MVPHLDLECIVCVEKQLVLHEMRLVIARVYNEFDIRLGDSYNEFGVEKYLEGQRCYGGWKFAFGNWQEEHLMGSVFRQEACITSLLQCEPRGEASLPYNL
jgi:hypothetical protein